MNRDFLRRFDWILFGTILLVLFFGLTMVFSTTINAQSVSEGKEAFQLQIIYACLGLFVFFGISLFNYRIFLDWWRFLYISICLSLFYVLFFGKVVNGARRWIDLGLTVIQPAEFAKFIIVIVVCAVLSQRSRFASGKHFLLIAGLVFVLPIVLILLEPDIGTAFIFVMLCLGLLLAMGVDYKYFLFIAVVSLAIFPVVWPHLKPYQQERLLTFFDPTRDPQGTGYNVTQAIIAIGAGGLFGVGLGQGTQSQFKFLPVRHTDFIFSVIAEELGMIGPLILFVLYGAILLRILANTREASDNFGRYLCLGVFVLLCMQIFINIGMNLGIMPVTGVPLPFVSSGGSSLLITFSLLGLVESVRLHSPEQKADEIEIRRLFRV